MDNLQVALPLPKNAIDAVLIFDVLQYIENWDNLFSYFFNALKPDGQVFIYPSQFHILEILIWKLLKGKWIRQDLNM